jgi:hypothetical protein
MKLVLVQFCVLLLALTSCSFPQFTRTPDIIQHDPPILSVDDSYFVSTNCYNDLSCLPVKFITTDPQYDHLGKAPDILGGLTPSIPLAVLTSNWYQPIPDVQFMYVKPCLSTRHVRYVARVGGELVLVDSVESMAAVYAPIESDEEALSYALATTGYSAVYDLESTPNLELLVDPLEETFVTETSEGYTVHLFDTFLCGCGPHIIRSVEVQVSRDGKVTQSQPVDAFRDPAIDDLCID